MSTEITGFSVQNDGTIEVTVQFDHQCDNLGITFRDAGAGLVLTPELRSYSFSHDAYYNYSYIYSDSHFGTPNGFNCSVSYEITVSCGTTEEKKESKILDCSKTSPCPHKEEVQFTCIRDGTPYHLDRANYPAGTYRISVSNPDSRYQYHWNVPGTPNDQDYVDVPVNQEHPSQSVGLFITVSECPDLGPWSWTLALESTPQQCPEVTDVGGRSDSALQVSAWATINVPTPPVEAKLRVEPIDDATGLQGVDIQHRTFPNAGNDLRLEGSCSIQAGDYKPVLYIVNPSYCGPYPGDRFRVGGPSRHDPGPGPAHEVPHDGETPERPVGDNKKPTFPPFSWPTLCAILEFIWIFLFILLILGSFAALANFLGFGVSLGNLIQNPNTWWLWPLMGFLAMGFEALVSNLLGLVPIWLIVYLLWLVVCKPSKCRILEDWGWVFGTALIPLLIIESLILEGLQEQNASGNGNWQVILVLVILLLYIVLIDLISRGLQDMIKENGCKRLSTTDWPWLR